MSLILRRNLALSLLIILAFGVLGLVAARVELRRNAVTPTNPRPTFMPSQGKSARNTNPVRNLALQPEALRLSRLLGQRFASEKFEQSNLIGVLSMGGEQKTVQTTRSQTGDGETVQIALAGTQTRFTWDGKEGPKSSEALATDGDRDLIERLVFDSPDQFVLAQLRGASYYTVARNVRATESSEKSGGALWNVIRVDDPQTNEAKRPLSRWRLYYINAITGLIDRIVSENGGQRITATLNWSDVQGEKVPSQIIWTRDGETFMQYQLTSFAHADTKGAKQ